MQNRYTKTQYIVRCKCGKVLENAKERAEKTCNKCKLAQSGCCLLC